MSSDGTCPLTGNVLWWVFPCLCTFRPSGRKRLLVGKGPVVGTKLWWCLPHLFSPQKLCLTSVCFPSFFPTTPAPPGVSFPPLLLHQAFLSHHSCFKGFASHSSLPTTPVPHVFLSHHSCFTRVCFIQFSSHSCSTCFFFSATPASQTRSALAGKKCPPALAAQQQAGLHLSTAFFLYMEHSCFWMKLHTNISQSDSLASISRFTWAGFRTGAWFRTGDCNLTGSGSKLLFGC